MSDGVRSDRRPRAVTRGGGTVPVAVLGVADHGGWAECVTVAAHRGSPLIVDRRRIALIEPGVPSQPYHHDTVGMPRPAAEALVARVRASVMQTTAAQLAALCDELRPQCAIAAMTLRVPTLSPIPITVADAHVSYSVMCRADGMMYHDALRTAAERLGLRVEIEERGRAIARAAERFTVSVEDVERHLRSAGERLGPPWQKEHRLAAAAAMTALAGLARVSLEA